jgi:hypothetical protein
VACCPSGEFCDTSRAQVSMGVSSQCMSRASLSGEDTSPENATSSRPKTDGWMCRSELTFRLVI